MYSASIQKLIRIFSKFPTVGPRTAARFVFYLIDLSKQEIDDFLQAISFLRSKINICEQCFRPFEIDSGLGKNLCSICADPRRNQFLICLVEKEIDLEAIEKSGRFKGVYFLLGNVFPLDKNKDLLEERVGILTSQIKQKQALGSVEAVIALNPNFEGQNASLWLRRRLGELESLKITQLAVGMPRGGEIEYADEETITSALDNRH